MSAMAVARGCGRRIKGGIYAECGLSPFGMPAEHFLVDPPMPVPDEWQLSAIGVQWVEYGGQFHVADHVGSKHYPNVADFVEEARRFGISRRIPSNAPFERLQPGARMLLVHSRAIITRPELYRPGLKEMKKDSALQPAVMVGADFYDCPKDECDCGGCSGTINADHRQGGRMCAGIWWEDVEWAPPHPAGSDDRQVLRTMPSFTYVARRAPFGLEIAQADLYQRGIFASVPLQNLVVVKDPDQGKHEQALERAKRAGLDVELVDE